jgi:hypothetical protein
MAKRKMWFMSGLLGVLVMLSFQVGVTAVHAEHGKVHVSAAYWMDSKPRSIVLEDFGLLTPVKQVFRGRPRRTGLADASYSRFPYPVS